MTNVGSRVSKLVTLAEATGLITDGMTVAIGGSLFHNKPMAAIRQIIRDGRRELRVIAVPQASIDVDLLIAAGVAREVCVPYLGFDYLGVAPSFRRAVEAGELTPLEFDETQLLLALDAGARAVPSAITKTGIGTDIIAVNPLLREITDPFTGEPVVAVAAIQPDVALLHADWSDRFGNIGYAGYPFADLLIAEATKRGGGRVIVTAERIVPDGYATAQPENVRISQIMVDQVVEVPFGAHPCSCHGRYAHDASHLGSYAAAASAGNATGYLDDNVRRPTTHEEYLAASLSASRVVELIGEAS